MADITHLVPVGEPAENAPLQTFHVGQRRVIDWPIADCPVPSQMLDEAAVRYDQ